MNRLLNSQEANRVPDGRHLTIVHGTGIGHGHWRLVWNVESRAVFADSLLDRTFPFDQTLDALAFVEQRRAKGKIVVAMPLPRT